MSLFLSGSSFDLIAIDVILKDARLEQIGADTEFLCCYLTIEGAVARDEEFGSKVNEGIDSINASESTWAILTLFEHLDNILNRENGTIMLWQ